MADNKEINDFKAYFNKKPAITIGEIRSYYRSKEPSLNDSTIRWRIHYLKNESVLITIGRGVYSLMNKPEWVPVVNPSIKSVYRKIENHYNDLVVSIWSTAWLNEFVNLQAFRYMVIIEVEKDFVSSVFDYLKETGLKNLYILPDKKAVNYYLSDAGETYVLETLITKSPTQMIEMVNVPKLEKILVDLFCDRELLFAHQSSELKNIFRNAFSAYALNISALINYARRRAREAELIDFIVTKADIKLHYL